ncbi:MAG: endonuclease III [Coriobacteriia bacterium]|nr:endonuclease III [Coriobacteriia bacterium]
MKMNVAEIQRRFEKAYPEEPRSALNFSNPYECICAIALSAQTTDVNVNKVTPTLFARYPDVASLAAAKQDDVEKIIYSLGFYRNKAKNLIGMARRIMAEYGGEVPATMDDLLTLPGVARKTANLVLSKNFGITEGIAVDTHVFRVSHRLSLSDAKTPDGTERDLCALFPREHWNRVNYEMIRLGREICDARKPLCARCFLNDLCPHYAHSCRN